MENSERTVIGVFMERDEAVSEIQRLHNLGYGKSEISVYGNPKRAQTVERLMGIHVEDAEVPEDEDDSWWDTIKDSFGFFAFHSEDGHQRVRIIEGEQREDEAASKTDDSMQGTLDLLAPYHQDLEDGKLVIVVDNYGLRNEK